MHKINLDETTENKAKTSNIKTTDTTTDTETKTELDEPTLADNNNHSVQAMKKSSKKITMIIAGIALTAGVATGYGGYKLSTRSGSNPVSRKNNETIERVAESDQVQVGDTFGVEDEKTFSDQAQGYLEAGGVNGEGSHRLLRSGGESQTVYLTSSITDLDQFVGMEVKIWGETFKGQKAGWLMDVGRVEVVKIEAEAPTAD